MTEETLNDIPEFKEPESRVELIELAKERMRPLVEEAEIAEAIKNEELKIKEELKRLEMAQREAEKR